MLPLLLLPFLGTLLGSSMVFLLRGEMAIGLRKLLLGFASGVMVAASIWSLILPAMEMSMEAGGSEWMPAAIGFVLGILFLLLLDTLIPHMHIGSSHAEGLVQRKQWQRTTMLSIAVTLHNIPEGMAVGVLMGSALLEGSGIAMSAAWSLAIGIAVQNFPEGAVLSLPLHSEGMSRWKSFWVGTLSGVVEPIACALTAWLITSSPHHLAISLGFCSGSYDVCGGGGTDSRVASRSTQQYSHIGFHRRFCLDDDPRLRGVIRVISLFVHLSRLVHRLRNVCYGCWHSISTDPYEY